MPEYLLRVCAGFEAAHHLTSYRGSPEPSHGHSWRVEAVIRAAELDAEGLGFDFVRARGALLELAGRFDHKDINRVPPFDRRTPSTEHLAAWFYSQLSERLGDAEVVEVTVWEGPHCAATYREG